MNHIPKILLSLSRIYLILFLNDHSSNNSEPSQEKVYQDEPNYSKIYKNSVQNRNEYVTGNDGKVYENKPCFNCSGEGFTIFINPASGQKETNICNACDGVGQIGYVF
ncbi:DnaJ-like cysteine-rich domain-containing protein [Paenimyroides viscosum]|uniref:Uncharacterized protein n=1 Tax=Paenimyroides viscosum TaxID=2488729 RepID=A0A3P1AMU5_9FLAO|nr:hypothetical protein [Paenimyroides viscosum]RRA90338.1 hypothetical protein EG242_13840 [Paenimyroides viscosum]